MITIEAHEASRIVQRVTWGFMVFCVLLVLAAPVLLAAKACLLVLLFLVCAVHIFLVADTLPVLTFSGAATAKWAVLYEDAAPIMAKLVSIRHFVWVMQLELVDDEQQVHRVNLWKDMVTTKQWRQLMVLQRLSQKYNNFH